MADTLYKKLGKGQYHNETYYIYSILKDYDHPYLYWYVLISYSTYWDTIVKLSQNRAEYKKWKEDICYKYMFDIRELSTYIPAQSIYEEGTTEYVVPIIRKSCRKGEITIA